MKEPDGRLNRVGAIDAVVDKKASQPAAKGGRPSLHFDDVKFSLVMQEAFARAGLPPYRAGRLTAALLGAGAVRHVDVGRGFVRVAVILDVTERGRTDRIVRRSREQINRVMKDPDARNFIWFIESIVALKGVVGALFDRDTFRLIHHLDSLVALGWLPILTHIVTRLLNSSPVDAKAFEDDRAARVIIPALSFYGWRRTLARAIVLSDGGADDGTFFRDLEEKSWRQGA